MNIRSLLILFILQAFMFRASSGISPVAKKGMIDLRYISNSEQFIVNLDGEWEFYWNKMLHPHDFKGKDINPDYYGMVPSYWTDYPKDKVRTERFGYATYRLRVLLPPGYRKSMAFDVPVFDSSYDIYINNKYFGGNGVPGRSESESEPGYRNNFFRFDPTSDTLTIIINVSNYFHRRGGFWLPIKIGTFSKVQKQLANDWAIEWSTISFLIGFSFFFLFFFLIYPKEKVMGFFCMATIGLALRPLFTSHFLIYNFADIGWTWTIRFEYLSLYLTIVGWQWFASVLYPSRIFKTFSVIMTGVFSIAFLLTIFLPVKIFSYATYMVCPEMIILMVYA